MAKQEIWIRLQDDLDRAYSVLRSLIDNEGCVCGLEMDSCRLLFKRISDIKDNKSLQIEFDNLPDNEKYGRAKKMLDCLMQYHLCGGRVEGYDSDKELAKMRQYAKKVNSLDTEMQKWEKDFSGLIYDIEVFVVGYCNDDSGSGRNEPQQYTEELIRLFNGHTTYIDKLKDINNKDTIIQLLYKWCDLKLEDEKKICKDPRPYGNPTGYARGLFESGVIPWENEGEKGHKKDINRLRQKISREG